MNANAVTYAKALSVILLMVGGGLLGEGVITEEQATKFSAAAVTVVGLISTWIASQEKKK